MYTVCCCSAHQIAAGSDRKLAIGMFDARDMFDAYLLCQQYLASTVVPVASLQALVRRLDMAS